VPTLAGNREAVNNAWDRLAAGKPVGTRRCARRADSPPVRRFDTMNIRICRRKVAVRERRTERGRWVD
jgi:hypothetical protein